MESEQKIVEPVEYKHKHDWKDSHTHVHHSGLAGGLWFMGWLFTIAFANLVGWKIVWGLLLWPYYLGLAVK